MGNRWAVWWVCQLEHWQLLLGLLQCKYNFLRLQYSGSESFFLLVSLIYLVLVIYFHHNQKTILTFMFIHSMYLHSLQKVMVRNFSSATILFLSMFPLPLYRSPVCQCCTTRKCAFPSKVPGQFSFCNDNRSQKVMLRFLNQIFTVNSHFKWCNN